MACEHCDYTGWLTRLTENGQTWIRCPLCQVISVDDPPSPGNSASEVALRLALSAVAKEVLAAQAQWPPMNSAHEAFAVMAEEVDELWQHVKAKQGNRDLAAMRREAIQVAAMAVRFAIEVCTEERGRK